MRSMCEVRMRQRPLSTSTKYKVFASTNKNNSKGSHALRWRFTFVSHFWDPLLTRNESKISQNITSIVSTKLTVSSLLFQRALYFAPYNLFRPSFLQFALSRSNRERLLHLVPNWEQNYKTGFMGQIVTRMKVRA